MSMPARQRIEQDRILELPALFCFRLQNSSPGPSLRGQDRMKKGSLTRPLPFLTDLSGPKHALNQ
jgi:hypothetical protein